jgi:MFS family permease
MLVVRFLFGAGEAGAWPCVTKTFSRWIPRQERGTVQGVFFMGAHLTGGATPLLVVYLSRFMPWRLIFVMFGALGFCWVAAWHWWFRDFPAQHKAESHHVGAVHHLFAEQFCVLFLHHLAAHLPEGEASL